MSCKKVKGLKLCVTHHLAVALFKHIFFNLKRGLICEKQIAGNPSLPDLKQYFLKYHGLMILAFNFKVHG